MAPDSWRDRIPVKLQILLVICVLCFFILAALFLTGNLPGPVTASHPDPTVHVKILAVNDLHGHIIPGQTMNNRPVGGIPVLASYLKAAMAPGGADGIIIALPGDVMGGSPPQSGLLLDEPSMLFFNTFANQHCTFGFQAQDPSCNMVATLGNQDFDSGVAELLRMLMQMWSGPPTRRQSSLPTQCGMSGESGLRSLALTR
jgi:5'-nucleotidase